MLIVAVAKEFSAFVRIKQNETQLFQSSLWNTKLFISREIIGREINAGQFK